MRKNKKRAFAAILSLLFGTPVFASCSNPSSSVAPHECVFYKVDAVEATCLHEGNIAYEQCPYCKKIQVNGAEKSLEDVTLPIDPKNHEQLRSVPEVPATCIADGTKAYQYCDACSNYVLDGVNYTDETIGDKLVLPKEAAVSTSAVSAAASAVLKVPGSTTRNSRAGIREWLKRWNFNACADGKTAVYCHMRIFEPNVTRKLLFWTSKEGRRGCP